MTLPSHALSADLSMAPCSHRCQPNLCRMKADHRMWCHLVSVSMRHMIQLLHCWLAAANIVCDADCLASTAHLSMCCLCNRLSWLHFASKTVVIP